MRPRAVAPPCLAVLIAALACGPVDAPPAGRIPINACPDFPCAAYTHTDPLPSCNGTTCISHAVFDPVLVIDLPESSFYAPTASLAITYTDLVKDRYHARNDQTASCNTSTCAVLPFIARLTGGYAVPQGIDDKVGLDLNRTKKTDVALVPSHVTYRPLWPAFRADAEAWQAGVPLLPVSASVTTLPFQQGPGGSPGSGWGASLMPGSYERTITPDPPFAAAFPPIVSVEHVEGDVLYLPTQPALDANEKLDEVRGLRVVRDDPKDPSLAGWTVYLRDKTTKRRVSEIVTLEGNGGASIFHLNTIAFGGLLTDKTSLPRVEKVVAPPPGLEAMPTLVDPPVPITGTVAPSPPVSNPLHYPQLPPFAVVSGMVQSPDADPVDATLLFEDASDSDGNGQLLTTDPLAPTKHEIHYATHVKTDAGRYTVKLPPGAYSVFVVPAEGTGLSAMTLPLLVAGPPSPSTQAGKNLAVARRTSVIGDCVVDDGRVLVGAEVEALPASELLGPVDPRRWPRAARTVTDDAGRFALSLDQGTYDLVVRPGDGSRLPWVVSTSHKIGAETLVLDPIRVPAPIAIDLELRAPGNSKIVHALVRAFASPAVGGKGGGSAGGAAAPVVEIGSSISDDQGNLHLFITPPQ